MATKLDIGKRVMDMVGAGNITSENDPTKRAKAFKRNFELSRQVVLCAARWGCATEQVELGISSTTTPLYGYSNAFEIPAGTLKIWEAEKKSWPHRRQGQFVLSNYDQLFITRTVDLVDIGLFTPDLVEALACHIAWKIAYQLTASREKEADCKEAYDEQLRTARLSNSVESDQYAESGSTWLDAAYTGVHNNTGNIS